MTACDACGSDLSEVNVMDDAADARVCVMCGAAWPGTKAHRVRALERAVVEAAKEARYATVGYGSAPENMMARNVAVLWAKAEMTKKALDAAVDALVAEEGKG